MTSPDRGQTHYEVLGVPPGATQAEIRAAYRQLASQFHPDRHQGNPLQGLAAARMAAINAAYEVLSDAQRRAAYDASLGYAGYEDRGRGPGGRSPSRTGTWLGILFIVGFALLVFRPLLFGALRLVALVARQPLVLAALLGIGVGIFYWRRKKRG